MAVLIRDRDGRLYAHTARTAMARRQASAEPGREIVDRRALSKGILDRAYARACGHAARDWSRLGQIAGSGTGLLPLPSHEDFAAAIRARAGRKVALRAHVTGKGRDRHDDEDLTP